MACADELTNPTKPRYGKKIPPKTMKQQSIHGTEKPSAERRRVQSGRGGSSDLCWSPCRHLEQGEQR